MLNFMPRLLTAEIGYVVTQKHTDRPTKRFIDIDKHLSSVNLISKIIFYIACIHNSWIKMAVSAAARGGARLLAF